MEMESDDPSPQFPVGCLIASESPEVLRRMGVVIGVVVSNWEFRRILWTDGRVTLEGAIYLGTFYDVIAPRPMVTVP